MESSREFSISGSLADSGPWETLLEEGLANTIQKPVSLLNFTFDLSVDVQFFMASSKKRKLGPT